MEANTKVVIFGSLGIGKSTVMNTISGEKANFQTGDEAVTQEPAAYKFSADGKEFIVVDTAGLNDYNMPLQLWIEKYTKYAKEKADGLPISLVIIAFRANVRPTAEQKGDVITALEAIKGLDAGNLAIVFTFCDGFIMKENN